VSNLTARVLTAVVAVPILLLAIFWSQPWGVYGLVSLAAIIAMREFFVMTLADTTERTVALVIGTAATQAFYWAPRVPGLGGALLPGVVIVTALFFLFRFVDIPSVARRWGSAVTGVFYAGVLFMYLAALKRDFDHGPWPRGGELVLLVLMIAWFGDTCAYFAGRFLGKTKLYPAVSPAKTRAGAVGGLLGSFLAAVLANLWFFPELGWVHGAILTIVGGALGQTGDLVESLLKRSVGVKDSGQLLPGHGGMLDRIDAVLFIAPWVYLYMSLAWRP
jgi:phosphatidate cytidylyltransferase